MKTTGIVVVYTLVYDKLRNVTQQIHFRLWTSVLIESIYGNG